MEHLLNIVLDAEQEQKNPDSFDPNINIRGKLAVMC